MEQQSILRGVVAYVEVRSGNDNRSAAISQELRQLGAQVEATFTDAVTHVVFKEGMKRTWNKAIKRKVYLVSVSWIDSCKQNQTQVAEKDFATSRPEEIASPLPRINQAVRWKKMKSMQPCDFDEELARSAERGEKKRKRMMMANRFTLNEDATPTSSSPIPILAFDTQARSPLLAAVSRTNNSPVPDTPPSMQKRLEKMREQRLVLGTKLDESPVATPKVPIDKQLQRRLLDVFASDFMNAESSDDDETSSRTVAKLINSLDSNSERSSQSSTDRKNLKHAGVKSAQGFSKATIAGQQTCSQVSSPACSSKSCAEKCAEMNQPANTSPDKEEVLKVSKKISGYSRLSLNESINQNSPTIKGKASLSKSPQNTENKSRRLHPSGKNKRMSSMSNALSPKDTNINDPSLNAKSTELQHTPGKMCPLSGSKLIKNFLTGDTADKNLFLEECMTRRSDGESALKYQKVGDTGREVKLIEPQLRHSGSRRQSSRQLLHSEVNGQLTSFSDCHSENMSTSTVNHLQIPLRSIRPMDKSLHADGSGTNKSISTGACTVNDGGKTNKCAVNESKDSMFLESSSAAPLKPMISRKKRNLLTETALTSLLCSSEAVSSHICSPGPAMPHKVTSHSLGSDMKSDISIMFGATKSKNKEQKEKNTQKRKQLNSKSRKTSIACVPSLEMDDINCVPNVAKITSNSLSKAAAANNITIGNGQQNNSSLWDSVLRNDMSMSIMYGNDTSVSNITKAGQSRRSLDEFSTGFRTSGRIKKLKKTCEPTSTTIQETEAELIDNDIVPKKGVETNSRKMRTDRNMQQIKEKSKRKRNVSSCSTSSDKKAAKKLKDCNLSSSTDGDNPLNESALSHDDTLTPARLRHAQSLVMEHKFQPLLKRSTYSLVVTSLHREEQETAYSVIKKLGLFHLTNNVEATSTHVVCGEPRRTLNVLKAIARGCWLLKKEWVLESLEADMWLHEEPYEMTDFPAAVKSRTDRQEVGTGYKVDLFSKLGAIFVSAVSTPPRKELVHLINLCCGHVTSSETRASIHLGDDHDPEKLVIKPAWILDCIMKLQILPTDDYIVFPRTLASQRESSPEF